MGWQGFQLRIMHLDVLATQDGGNRIPMAGLHLGVRQPVCRLVGADHNPRGLLQAFDRLQAPGARQLSCQSGGGGVPSLENTPSDELQPRSSSSKTWRPSARTTSWRAFTV